MGDGGFFKGTSADQDSRFSNKHRKLLKSMTFPASFKKKVDMSKVNMNVMRLWIARRIKELLGIEDEVVVEFVYGMLEEKDLDPRRIQIDLTGFLEDKAPQFVVELWDLLLSAQENVAGVPAVLIEEKAAQLKQTKMKEQEIRRRINALHEKEAAERGTDTKSKEQIQTKNESVEHKRMERSSEEEPTRTMVESGRNVASRRNRSHDRYRDRARNRDRNQDRHNHHHRRRSRSRSRSMERSRYSRDRTSGSHRDSATTLYDRDDRHRSYRSGYNRDRHQSNRDRDHYKRRERSREDARHRSHHKSSTVSDVEGDQSEDLERSRRQRRHRTSTNPDTNRDATTMEE